MKVYRLSLPLTAALALVACNKTETAPAPADTTADTTIITPTTTETAVVPVPGATETAVVPVPGPTETVTASPTATSTP